MYERKRISTHRLDLRVISKADRRELAPEKVGLVACVLFFFVRLIYLVWILRSRGALAAFQHQLKEPDVTIFQPVEYLRKIKLCMRRSVVTVQITAGELHTVRSTTGAVDRSRINSGPTSDSKRTVAYRVVSYSSVA